VTHHFDDVGCLAQAHRIQCSDQFFLFHGE
jgi:hypothetical protein